ncbi:hypothetical protein [Methylopila sp. 73B]|uniref:hypothetical protein n=1 Tax=Methylopila sp. 73B TaxID=1120792 RepID=UPI00035C5E96|nr:hypothetical protein [Methylopila sp. 73B]
MIDEKAPIDWEAIKRDYGSGSMSIRELSRWYSISDTAIRKRAKKEAWLQPEPQASSHREPANPAPRTPVEFTRATPETTSADAIIGRGRNLTLRMLDELDATTMRLGELETMIDMATDEGDGGRQRETLMQAVSLKQRSEVLKALATAAKTLSESGAAAPAGKKAERQAAAERAAGSGGRYAPPAPPKVVVDNTR